jgi:hypothetical protein
MSRADNGMVVALSNMFSDTAQTIAILAPEFLSPYLVGIPVNANRATQQAAVGAHQPDRHILVFCRHHPQRKNRKKEEEEVIERLREMKRSGLFAHIPHEILATAFFLFALLLPASMEKV